MFNRLHGFPRSTLLIFQQTLTISVLDSPGISDTFRKVRVALVIAIGFAIRSSRFTSDGSRRQTNAGRIAGFQDPLHLWSISLRQVFISANDFLDDLISGLSWRCRSSTGLRACSALRT